jgi:hypothetical protein
MIARCFLLCILLTAASSLQAQAPAPPSAKTAAKTSATKSAASQLDPGTVTNGVYSNKALGLTCKVPEGWVLRTDELNARQEEKETQEDQKQEAEKKDPAQTSASSAGAKVLLAAFSRPPEAKAEEVNSSVLIAAESVAAYPGLTEAAQYFFPLTEVAKAQGFTQDEDPYDIAIGNKKLVRGDFHKDVGTRVMRQSTLAMLSHGYAISITVIAGTDDDVEDLIDGISFGAAAK